MEHGSLKPQTIKILYCAKVLDHHSHTNRTCIEYLHKMNEYHNFFY